MCTHPNSRARRRELARFYKEPRDAFNNLIKAKDKHAPRVTSTPYCPACHKEKLQFGTEAEAERYILYNAEKIKELNGWAPIRTYYCRICGCWHVTSKEKRIKSVEKSN